jgi:uncharacterized protein with von Willebrand factor type A (vWA) domain
MTCAAPWTRWATRSCLGPPRLLRKGSAGRRGLDDLLRRARERQREIRGSGRLDGILEQARALLDTAVGQERAELFPDPSDEARLCEADLDALPADTAHAIRQLADYDWRSPAARETFERLRQLLRSEVLDSQFRGMRQALQNPDPQAMQRIKDMLGDLNEMLAADARGEHTQADFDEFMSRYGDLFPDHPQNLEELVDSLVSRMAAAERLLRSLSEEQRQELAGLMSNALDDAGLESEMASRENTYEQNSPGEGRNDIDEDAGRRAFGRQAVDDVEALRRIERELERQGYLTRNGGRLELTPKAVRRLGDTALRRIFTDMSFGHGAGDHDQRDAGQAGELTGTTRPWEFGDEQPLDGPATVRNALLRGGWGGASPRGTRLRGGVDGRIKLSARDFEVAETERRTAAVVSLLVDLSYSMQLRGTWAAAKQTALALHALLRSRFPQDAIQVVGFSNYARELRETDLAGLGWDMVQGTNLHHALMIAGRHIDRHPEHEPVVLIVTDGEPTAHLQRDGRSWFDWPPSPETLELTLAEVDKMTRRHAALNIFMLADDARLSAFVDNVARRNGGRVLQAAPERLGEYVIRDFLRTRRVSRR